MVLNNILIFQGSYYHIKDLKEELNLLSKNQKRSKLFSNETTKYMKKIIIYDEIERNYLYELKITFEYHKNNLLELIDTFKSSQYEVIHMCENAKNEIWIVNDKKYIKEFRLIPEFAIKKILLEYMRYKESAIILDSYETIKYDRNNQNIVIEDRKLNHEELLNLLFEKTIKNKGFYVLIEQFIDDFYEKCINNYEDLYSINKVQTGNEEPSPLALFIVTFGIIGIIFLLVILMGYL